MVDINWKRFEAKFNGRENEAFEDLAYLLFCQEHNKPFGIFGYTNQTGFETEPIEIESEIVGFQAKYFKNKLDKSNIKDSIAKAKKRHPRATGIYLYTNVDIYEGKKDQSPKYKKEIEEFANKQGMKLTWKVKSQIEAQLKQLQNHHLAEYFFTEEDSVIDLIQNLNTHSKNLLNTINTDIAFKENSIRIDRSKELQEIEEKLKPFHPVIISGVDGSGKTALIKEFCASKKDIPFYFFKANEFKLNNLELLLQHYGKYHLKDFLTAHKEENTKIVVIDSAEKLSDLENQEPFKEFLSALLENSWSVVFTTRHSYLDNLIVELSEIFRLQFSQINLSQISNEELLNLSQEYNFHLPQDKRMKDVLRTPLYLNLYLKRLEIFLSDTLVYSEFKDAIWNNKIKNNSYTQYNTHIQREKCFMDLIDERIITEKFYLEGSGEDNEILDLLIKDEIIEYDEKTGKYFITHDIYEEWGVDKFIERKYKERIGYYSFLQSLGTTLIVRRGFRNWLSDKLIDEIEDIKEFIENSFESNKIDDFWKDEILVSILLSEYSSEFFDVFENDILKDEGKLLERIIFLLRIGCKKPNEVLIKSLTQSSNNSFKYYFTIPTGKGWETTINFISKHKDIIPNTLISHIKNLLKDWSDNFKSGATTREVASLGLQYYDLHKTQGNWRLYDRDVWLQGILNSATEIADELHNIFLKFLDLNYDRRENYFDLCEKVIGSNVNARWVAKTLPDDVIKLMYFFWTDNKVKDNGFGGGIGLEKQYGLNDYRASDYFPASAYQTPVFQLLKSHPYKTLIFIVDFINRSIKRYFESEYDSTVKEIAFRIGDKKYSQYASSGIWNTFRGNSSPVVPNLIQSIHMALEKYLLNILEAEIDNEIIEEILIDYLLKRTKSASVTAVVASIVSAYPECLFETAKILFSCDEFLQLDKQRANMEFQMKNLYSIGAGLNLKNKLYEEERLKTLKDNYRKLSLEDLILRYQFLRPPNLSDTQFETRKKEIWKILDSIYAKIPPKSEQSEEDKTRRILLTRVDFRKMNQKTEIRDDELLIDFNHDIDPELEEHSKKYLKHIQHNTHWQELFLWGVSKFDARTKGDYPKYENSPKVVLEETKSIIKEFKDGNKDWEFRLFNRSIPGFTCAALIRDYSESLSLEDKDFCEEIIIEFSTLPFNPEYVPQLSDGVESSINVLPSLMKEFPKKRVEYLTLLFLILFDKRSLGNKRICDYAIQVIRNNEGIISEKEICTFIYGINKYQSIFRSKLKIYRKNKVDLRFSFGILMREFIEENEEEIKYLFVKCTEDSQFSVDEAKGRIDDLIMVFDLIPNDTKSEALLNISKKITSILAKELFIERDFREEQKMDLYNLRLKFFRKFSYFLLLRDTNTLKTFLYPFIKNFLPNQNGISFLSVIITANCFLSKYTSFWEIWNEFYPKIKEIVQINNRYTSDIIHYYLLAWPYWKDSAKDWHSLKEKNKRFYKKASRDSGED